MKRHARIGLVAAALLWSAGSSTASALECVLTTNSAPAGYVEIDGVEAGPFNPKFWQANTLNLLPDLRFPLLAPLEGNYRNIYAPSAVETTAGYRLFYGAWDGTPTGNDRIYSARTDAGFQNFTERHTVLRPGTYNHVCNVNALGFEDGSLALLATVYPVQALNKPAFFRADATGTNWNGRAGEPTTVLPRDLVEIAGYNFAAADINGMNVLLREAGSYRLYFGDFNNRGVFRATSAEGSHYAFERRVYEGAGFVNDVKRFRVGSTNFYLMGLHENGTRLWQTLSTNGLAFPAASLLFTNLAEADRYIVALGWVVRGRQEEPGRKLLGVLYGAGPVPSLDQNRIHARWLQKRVVFVAVDGTRIGGTRSLGPDRQLLPFPASGTVRGKFEVYAEDGQTLLGTSPEQAVRAGQTFQLP